MKRAHVTISEGRSLAPLPPQMLAALLAGISVSPTMQRRFNHWIFLVVCSLNCFGQPFGDYDRSRGLGMLHAVADGLYKNYYDPTYRGVDIEARFATTARSILRATSNSQIFASIAGALQDLNDSHTFFVPPDRKSVV